MSTNHLLGRELPLATAIEHGQCGIGFVVGRHQGPRPYLNPELDEIRTVREWECARLRDWIEIPKRRPYSLSFPCSAKFRNPRTIRKTFKPTCQCRYCLTMFWERRPFLFADTRAQEMSTTQPVAGLQSRAAVDHIGARPSHQGKCPKERKMTT